MKDIRKKIKNWRMEATSPRNDGWVSTHYRELILEAYTEIKEVATSIGLVPLGEDSALPFIDNGGDDD